MKNKIFVTGCILYLSNFIAILMMINLSIVNRTYYSDYANQFLGFLHTYNLMIFFILFIILLFVGIAIMLYSALNKSIGEKGNKLFK